jgi:hypothetical protein
VRELYANPRLVCALRVRAGARYFAQKPPGAMKNKDLVSQEGKNKKIRGQILEIIFFRKENFPLPNFAAVGIFCCDVLTFRSRRDYNVCEAERASP